jgi:chitodextrinase
MLLVLGILTAGTLLVTNPAQGAGNVTVWVYRFQILDELDPSSSPETRYWVGLGDLGTWSWQGPFALPQGDDILANGYHTFAFLGTTLGIAIVLCDDDDFTADDSTDLSGSPGGGVDDDGCAPAGLPPSYAYNATWHPITNALGGDPTTVELGLFKSSGDSDGSTAVDENDAAVWFLPSTSATPLTADPGPGQTVLARDVTSFNGSDSTAFNGSTLAEYAWDFTNDGTFDAFGVAQSYVYLARGSYTVRLRVTDTFGRTSETTTTVTVLNHPPAAGFEVDRTADVGSIVRLTDTSSDLDGTIVAWNWSFGDGGVSSQRNPSHTYVQPGEYIVRLEVTDELGGTSRVGQTVDVQEALLARLLPFLLAGLLVTLLIGWLALRKRRGRDKAPAEKSAPR